MTEALIYPDRVNTINGESGSGKSWIALMAAYETMAAGGHVIYIDLEDHPLSVVARLKALGATNDQLRNQLTYIRPDRSFSPAAEIFLVALIRQRQTALVVIDSIGELMALEGCKPNDDDAVASLYRRIPRMLARLGPAVLLTDHVPKNNEHSPLYGIGSQRKRAAIDGASYMVEQVKAFSADRDGKIKLTTAKDRNGNYATGTVAAEVDVTVPGPNQLRLHVRAPASMGQGGEFVPTIYMEKISRYLEERPDKETSRNVIIDGAGLTKRQIATAAFEKLVELGYLSRRGEGQKHVYTLLRSYREAGMERHGDDGDTYF